MPRTPACQQPWHGRQSFTKKYKKDQSWEGGLNQAHRADQYTPSAPIVQPPYNQPTNSQYSPSMHPSIQDKISGSPSAPYPGNTITPSNNMVELKSKERDSDGHDTDEDISMEMNRLKEEIARIELKGKGPKYMKRSVQ